MNKNLLIVAASLATSTCLLSTPVNITIADGQAGNGATAPWSGTPGLGAGHEDNETEPGTYTGDIWDLEALVYNPTGSMLSLVGTFDFKNGVPAHGVTGGAMFLKSSADASWVYAYVFDFANNTYKLYNNFITVAPTDIPGSTPANISSGNLLGSGSFVYTTGILDPFGLNLQRDSGTGHNEIDLGLNLLPVNLLNSFDVHYTMSCGNDDIEGHFQSPPGNIPGVGDGGLTAALLGLGMSGLILLVGKNPALRKV
jgi:hypothetical protein